MKYIDIAKAQLIVDEGVRYKPYVDTVGKITIGVGRNLSDVGLSEEEIQYLFSNDLQAAEVTARSIFKYFSSLTDNRKAVLCNMAFNLGHDRLSQFRDMIGCVNVGDYNRAADAMMRSLWATQVGERAKRLAILMRTG